MAPCSSKLLLVNGVPLAGDVPPVATFLQSTAGAYTTTRTYGGASLVLFLERHIRRLVHSARLLSQSRPSLFSAGSVPAVFPLIDSVPHRIHDSLEIGLRLALRDRDRSGSTDELAITALVRGRCDSDGLDVLLHVGFFIPPPFGAFGARLAVAGPGRDLAEAKYSDWVRVRQGLEKMRPPSVTELLLTNDGDSILEGTVTNFFVVRRKVIHDFTEPPPTEQELCSFVVQTAPISDGILPGVIRQLVIEICSSMNIPIEEVAPSWSDHALWQEAFITSSLRLVQHVETIQFPTSSKILHTRSFQEFSWATKQFQGIGHITRHIQNEIINRAAEESFKINQYS
ncbi:uncharacterized protein LOC122008608 [Zingiber officinale]|uniref:uncharacterized protein LOC122008608 n=1 Tax=Zingiber officinale TaxID=94328 RepID=UPI001C4C7CCB|nr:uncharacterized protein LOC122008608 [Zingiber officinale]